MEKQNVSCKKKKKQNVVEKQACKATTTKNLLEQGIKNSDLPVYSRFLGSTALWEKLQLFVT